MPNRLLNGQPEDSGSFQRVVVTHPAAVAAQKKLVLECAEESCEWMVRAHVVGGWMDAARDARRNWRNWWKDMEIK